MIHNFLSTVITTCKCQDWDQPISYTTSSPQMHSISSWKYLKQSSKLTSIPTPAGPRGLLSVCPPKLSCQLWKQQLFQVFSLKVLPGISWRWFFREMFRLHAFCRSSNKSWESTSVASTRPVWGCLGMRHCSCNAFISLVDLDSFWWNMVQYQGST